MKMTERENALRTIRFDNPEYIMEGMPEYTLAYTGCNHESYDGGGDDRPVGTRWTDIWGTGWRKEQADVMGFPSEFPLADVASLKDYVWPDPADGRIVDEIYRRRAQYEPGDRFLSGSHRDTLWEKSYMLVGMENMMAYLYTEPGYAREILHRIMDFQLGIARHYLDLGVEMVNMGDDLGTQNSLLIGKETLRDFFVPEYKRLFELYKARNVIINFHSCGHIEPLLDLLLELGVDILNPIQATANDLQQVRRMTDRKMTIQGGVSTSLILHGPVEAIDTAVKEAILLLGQNGGYFCAPDQEMPFAEAHLAAFHEAVKRYGTYPL